MPRSLFIGGGLLLLLGGMVMEHARRRLLEGALVTAADHPAPEGGPARQPPRGQAPA